jgi:hypothetical protein
MKHLCRQFKPAPTNPDYSSDPAGRLRHLLLLGQQTNQPPEGRSRARASWYKGNIHAHTIAPTAIPPRMTPHGVSRPEYHFPGPFRPNTPTEHRRPNALRDRRAACAFDRDRMTFNPFA